MPAPRPAVFGLGWRGSRGMIRRHAKASSAAGFVPRPTPLCSQRTNRNRANQRVAILNDRFTSCCAPDVTERLHALRLLSKLVARSRIERSAIRDHSTAPDICAHPGHASSIVERSNLFSKLHSCQMLFRCFAPSPRYLVWRPAHTFGAKRGVACERAALFTDLPQMSVEL